MCICAWFTLARMKMTHLLRSEKVWRVCHCIHSSGINHSVVQLVDRMLITHPFIHTKGLNRICMCVCVYVLTRVKSNEYESTSHG